MTDLSYSNPYTAQAKFLKKIGGKKVAKSWSSTSVVNETESVTFGEGAQSTFIGRGTTITNTGLQDEGVAALTSGISDVVKTGYSALSEVVGKLQQGTESTISSVEKAYAKSSSGTAGLDALRPYIFGAIALGAIAILTVGRGGRR